MPFIPHKIKLAGRQFKSWGEDVYSAETKQEHNSQKQERSAERGSDQVCDIGPLSTRASSGWVVSELCLLTNKGTVLRWHPTLWGYTIQTEIFIQQGPELEAPQGSECTIPNFLNDKLHTQRQGLQNSNKHSTHNEQRCHTTIILSSMCLKCVKE